VRVTEIGEIRESESWIEKSRHPAKPKGKRKRGNGFNSAFGLYKSLSEKRDMGALTTTVRANPAE